MEGVAQGEAAPQAAEPDQAVEVTDTLLEQEQLNVVASASVQTSDGQTLQLDLGFVLDWRQLEVSQRRTTLNALKDPLVLSLDGKIADLTEVASCSVPVPATVLVSWRRWMKMATAYWMNETATSLPCSSGTRTMLPSPWWSWE